MFAMIWGSYIATDARSGIFGSLLGHNGSGSGWRCQCKSIAGTVAGFLAALVLCVGRRRSTSAAHGQLAMPLPSTRFELYRRAARTISDGDRERADLPGVRHLVPGAGAYEYRFVDI